MMEITNNSRYYSIPLVVGRRIAQIVFFDTDGTINENSYEKGGKYQASTDVQTLEVNWKPCDMLPRMYLDREIQCHTANLNSVVELSKKEICDTEANYESKDSL